MQREKEPEERNIWTHRQRQVARLGGQSPEKRKIRSGTNKSGKEACGGQDLWAYAQNMKIFVLHTNMHQRTPTTEEELNDQVD